MGFVGEGEETDLVRMNCLPHCRQHTRHQLLVFLDGFGNNSRVFDPLDSFEVLRVERLKTLSGCVGERPQLTRMGPSALTRRVHPGLNLSDLEKFGWKTLVLEDVGILWKTLDLEQFGRVWKTLE